ncbi:MAG: glycosyltransferase [Alphaproteobacteria bacterium]|nr:glycosyltransferase [Alphaproteobacteria bacterium]
MNLLQISSNDLVGRRFNGYDLHGRFAARGIAMRYLAWNARARSDFAGRVLPYPGSRLIQKLVTRKLEKTLSLQSVLPVHAHLLPLQRDFRRADLVHYHVIHDGWFGLGALPALVRRKPSVWTWHDLWPVTGHCMHPIDCPRWQSGCGECPDLATPFPLRRDRTAQLFARKRRLYEGLDLDVVVASRWMLERARRAPLAAGFRLHRIPFGLDLALYAPGDRDAARARFGIEAGNRVVALRAFRNPFKGTEAFAAAVASLGEATRLTILTVQEKGHFDTLRGRHQVVDLGWVDDDATMRDVYAAADFLAMPSAADSFGLMAIEAMACGRPVLCFEGTAVPETAQAPEIGLAVPRGDVAALAAALRRWIDDPDEVAARGRRARAAAEQDYDVETQADRLAALYREVAARRARPA